MELPYSAVNVLRQIRNTFDQEKLDELADSLHYRGDSADGHRRCGLLQPPSVGIHTPESAHIYLEQLNAAWDTNYCLGDLTIWPSVDGPSLRNIDCWMNVAIVALGSRFTKTVCQLTRFWCVLPTWTQTLKAFPRQFVENNARKRSTSRTKPERLGSTLM